MASRRRYPKGAERRQGIIAVAFDVLSRDGYRKTSLGQIGRAIGIDSAHILYYFPSREALLQEVLQRWDSLNDDAGGDPSVPFSWWVETIRRNESNRGIVQLYTSFAVEAADEEHPAHAWFRARFARIRQRVSDEIAGLQRVGRCDAGLDPDGVADLLISLSDGLQVRWLIDPSTSMTREFERALRVLVALDLGTAAAEKIQLH